VAALDFPAGATTGTTYAGGNGVVYTFNGTVWLASGASAGGDFCAKNAVPIASSATPVVLVPDTVVSGNSTGAYSTSTGKYTPPAGRYFIYGQVTGSSTVPVHVQSWLSKNGSTLQTNLDTSAVANQFGDPSIGLVVDANGTDYFELLAVTIGAAGTHESVTFLAFPISGIKGPPGDAGPVGTPTSVLQTRMFQTGAVATGTGIIPFDNTIPQISEGSQLMSLVFTPLSATSKLIITIYAALSSSASVAMTGALFRDSVANALAAMYQLQMDVNGYNVLSFIHTMTSGTTSAITFRFRAGGDAASTTTLNGLSGGRLLGGVMASSIVIQEVAP
jgi:hypothetical protein